MSNLDQEGTKTESSSTKSPPLSKRQKKKLAKHEKWLQLKPLKRARERERLKERRAQMKARGECLGPNRKLLKAVTMERSPCRVRVAIDLSFDHLMTDRDILKALKQVQNCYATNRRSSCPLQLYLTSYNGKSKDGLEARQNCTSWDINFREQHYLEAFDQKSVVYLTSESPNVLQILEDDKVYIIGGLVDHNQHKGLCHKLAVENGVDHGRLPIDEHVLMKTRQVLAVNHVFQILSKWTQGVSWEEAFLSTLPPRKGALIKTDDDDDACAKMGAVDMSLTVQDSNDENSIVSDGTKSESQIRANSSPVNTLASDNQNLIK